MNQTQNEYPLNYIYFGLLFFLLAGLQLYYIGLLGDASSLIRDSYVFLVVLESAIEASILAMISGFLLKRKMKVLHVVYLCLVTLYFLLRVVDFAIVRLMDVSVWHWIELIFQETFTNFIEMLYATNLPLYAWGMGFFGVLLVLFLSVVFFYLTLKICQKKPLLLSFRKALGFCLIAFLAIGTTDVFLYISHETTTPFIYAKALPWKRSLRSFPENEIDMKGYLKHPETSALISQMDSNLFSLERKPDIFLFVVESLRGDYLTQDITPSLASFRSDYTNFSKALSVANGTHKTWFSLFYSLYPFHWRRYQPEHWDQGSMPLTLLKKMGYQIHVYASSRLNYYSMDEVLFCKKHNLVEPDHMHEFREDGGIEASITDGQAIDKLCEDIQNSPQKGGRLFVVFLDSTHFHYSWPKDHPPHFSPVEDQIDYLEVICQRKGMEIIKNRYKNSLRYIDILFARFKKTLQEKGDWDDSMVIFTADHGEEFNEYGCVFHASGLSLPQLQIPLYIKLAQDPFPCSLQNQKCVSQVDIFPTIFHYLTGEDSFGNLFQGESLFEEPKKNYVVGARYNAGQVPYEFYIQKENYRLILEFSNTKDIFRSRFVKIKSLLNEKEEKVAISPAFIENHFADAFHHLFSMP